MATNKKKVLYTDSMGKAGIEILKARGDVEAIPFNYFMKGAEYQALLKQHAPVHAVILGGTPFHEAEYKASNGVVVVARTGVGYDAIDIPAMTKVKVPVMIAGTANSPSVAEQAMTFMLTLARKGPALTALVAEGRWADRLKPQYVAVDMFEKTVLIIGFGRIGTRTGKRCLAMEMTVLVYDPYVKPETIKAAGCEPVAKLDDAIPRADFITIHCPKTPETIGMFNAERMKKMKRTAYLVSTARGGIVDEKALHQALTDGTLPAAALDVFDREPPDPANPLFKLPNIILSPHIAGVTAEAMERMAAEAAKNVLSVFDGHPRKENAVNPEVFG
ncbi:MAG: hydroxyacid dehydrogenase [Proteobacteria bacterium]|nr:hydroxyacid dehydrogenase [Pseudomonadota bacterium]